MDLKPQEILVLLKVSAHPERKFTFAALAEELAMSAAEVHASVKRARGAGLVNERGRGDWSPIRPALLEFLIHGVRYASPAEVGPVKRGVPIAESAWNTASTAGSRLRSTGSNALPESDPERKSAIVVGAECRVKSSTWNSGPVAAMTPGKAST